MEPRERVEVSKITPEHFERHPVWTFQGSGNEDTTVRPMEGVPVAELGSSLVGATVTFSGGKQVFAMFGNVLPRNPRGTKHLMTVSFSLPSGKWFHLARYHDPTRKIFGPEMLAVAFKLPVDRIFPIAYDLTPFVVGDPQALKGTIVAEPDERLTRAEALALGR